MHLAVGLHQAGQVRAQHLPARLVPRAGGDVRVQAPDGALQAVLQRRLAVGVALGAGRLGVRRRPVRPMPDFPAQRRQPFERGLFDVVFGDATCHAHASTNAA